MLVPVAVTPGQCQRITELTHVEASPDRDKVTGEFPFLETSVWVQPQGATRQFTKCVLSADYAPGSMIHTDVLLYVQSLLLLSHCLIIIKEIKVWH